jgi:uncharacterized membrane protein (DUF485 family)
VFTEREIFGLALFAAAFFAAANVVYVRTGLRPRVFWPSQSERTSAAAALLPVYVALSVAAGAGSGWLVAGLTRVSDTRGGPVAVAVLVGVSSAALLLRRARTLVPRNAEQAQARRQRRRGDR